MSTQWTSAFPLSELPVGGARVFRRGRDQVAVFRTDPSTLYAVDNRCPHEGYPLVQGARKGCTLTCCWHNYKFDLRDGACIKGAEAVRTFPVRIAGDRVELDMSPPDRRAALPGYWASMSEGICERRVGQAVRDAVRLLDAGVPPAELAAAVAAHNGERAEWGATHVLPLAADALRWAERYPGPRFAIPLAQVIDLAARDGVRRPVRPAAAPIDPGPDPRAAGRELREAVEAEDGRRAEGLLLGALARGWGRAELEPQLLQLCADHFLSFGHRLIYQVKCMALLDAVGWDSPWAAPILRGHLFGIVSGTREDVLPAWAGFRARLAALDLPALYAAAGSDPGWAGGSELRAAALDGKPAEALDALTEALRAGAPLRAVIDALSLAAAERMLRFDVAIDADPSCQDSWLSVTHIQTYTAAVREALGRLDHPDVLRLIYYALRFVNHHRVLDGPPEPIAAAAPDLEATLAAILGGDTAAALSGAAALFGGPQLERLREALMDLVITDRLAVPIVSAHAMKNLVVAFEEGAHTGDARPVLALVRLLSSPLQQRWVHRGALEALAFVTEGRIPRRLAP